MGFLYITICSVLLSFVANSLHAGLVIYCLIAFNWLVLSYLAHMIGGLFSIIIYQNKVLNQHQVVCESLYRVVSDLCDNAELSTDQIDELLKASEL